MEIFDLTEGAIREELSRLIQQKRAGNAPNLTVLHALQAVQAIDLDRALREEWEEWERVQRAAEERTSQLKARHKGVGRG